MTSMPYSAHAPRTAQDSAELRAFAFGGPGRAIAEARVPLRLAHCTSPLCPQAERCAHADLRLCDLREPFVDGMTLRHTGGSWCPIFIDARGVHPTHLHPLEAA